MPLVADARANIDLVILANHVQVINEQRTNVLLTKELVSNSSLPTHVLGFLINQSIWPW